MTTAGPTETVLVVEDDPSIRLGLQMNLRSEGYRVLCAGTGPEGLRLATGARPDLVLLDLMLPGHSGLDLLRRLRAAGHEMPVIILTAMGLESDKVTGLRLGADDYVTKPFSVAELLARIDAALRRPRQQKQDSGPFEPLFADVEVDRTGRRIRRADREVSLTTREYDLLLHLADRAGRVLTREQLLSAVWGHDYEGTPRTVDNFVRSLRVKLEQNPQSPRHLLTVRGLGYRFERG